jgi:hypothetical protein
VRKRRKAAMAIDVDILSAHSPRLVAGSSSIVCDH